MHFPLQLRRTRPLTDVVIPHWTLFGWMTLIPETFIGVTLILTLILGLGTRLGSLVAIGMAANITLSILNVPPSGAGPTRS